MSVIIATLVALSAVMFLAQIVCFVTRRESR